MAERNQPLDTTKTSMILVMGLTGSGKSRFINTLVKGSTREYAGLRSGTQHCQMVQTKISEDESVVIVDTPGFDDSSRSDAEIFSLITTYLMSQYLAGIPLKGIIYLHRITDPKMSGSALRNFQMFQEICGEKALGSVVLLTTMWDKLISEEEGYDRDQELREDFWSLMEERGSYIARFDGSKEMAEAMIIQLLSKEPIVLGIQRELQVEGKRLEETAAGRLLVPNMEARLNASKKQIKDLEARIRDADAANNKLRKESLEKQRRQYSEQRRREEEERRKLQSKIAQETEQRIQKEKKSSKWKGGVSLFASLTGVAVGIVVNVLPLFGVNV